jgi:hypothetical protein
VSRTTAAALRVVFEITLAKTPENGIREKGDRFEPVVSYTLAATDSFQMYRKPSPAYIAKCPGAEL